jgi:ribosomal protein L37AE/L43A
MTPFPAHLQTLPKQHPHHQEEAPMPIPTTACPGPCIRRAREAWIAYCNNLAQHVDDTITWLRTPPTARTPQPPAAPPPPAVPATEGLPVFCRRCAQLIRAALTELDDLAAVLAATADGHRPGVDRSQKTTTSKSTPSPSPIADTLDDLYGMLVAVEDQWREARGYQARPRRTRGSHARTTVIAWLLDHLDAILAHPGSVEFGLDVLRWQRRLRTMAKADPAVRRSPIRCPRCSERKVHREDDGYYKCHSCERLMSQDEHDREYGEQAAELDHQAAPAS